jgi:hypothetical protein
MPRAQLTRVNDFRVVEEPVLAGVGVALLPRVARRIADVATVLNIFQEVAEETVCRSSEYASDSVS